MYVVPCLVQGGLWWAGQARSAPVPSLPASLPLIVGSVLLLVGTVWPKLHLAFLTGVIAIMFGLAFRAWELTLNNAGSVGARVSGILVYVLIILGLALTTMFSQRIDV